MKRALLLITLAVFLLAILIVARWRSPAEVGDRNRKFASDMERVVLTGHSTRGGSDKLFGPERYYIDSVTHLSGDTWLFRSRFEHGGRELPVPIPITVAWAGDTPVISLTDLSIPGAGTFTARVVMYRGQYSGTWSGGKSGGHLFGKIERQR